MKFKLKKASNSFLNNTLSIIMILLVCILNSLRNRQHLVLQMRMSYFQNITYRVSNHFFENKTFRSDNIQQVVNIVKYLLEYSIAIIQTFKHKRKKHINIC